MSIPTITPLPQAPQVTDAPSVFSQRANTFVAALAQLVTETNATTAEINQALAGALVLFDGFKGDWEAGSFGAGDVVRKDNVFYISLVDSNTQEPPGSDWQELLSNFFKGDWQPGSFAAGDVVRKDDVFYLSLVDSNTQEPPDSNWQELLTALSTTFDPSNVALTGETVQAGMEQLCTLPVSAKTASYTLAASDIGGLVSISSGDVTVAANEFDAGDTVVIYNDSATSRSIERDSGVTMYWVNGQDADRTILQRGLATIVCVGSNEFVITGQGLS